MAIYIDEPLSKILTALEESIKETQVEASETARVRAGLRLLAAKEDMQAFHDNEFERLTPGRGFKR